MSLDILALRAANLIPTPVVVYGARISRDGVKTVPFKDPSLRRVIYEAGGDPQAYRAILTSNQIGSVFDGGLEDGTPLSIPVTQNTFSSHPEA